MAVTVVGPRALPGNSQRVLCVPYNHLLRHSHPAPPRLPQLPLTTAPRTPPGLSYFPLTIHSHNLGRCYVAPGLGSTRFESSTQVTRAFSSLVRKQTELIFDFIQYLQVRRRFRELLVNDVPCLLFQVAPDRRRSVVQFCLVSLLTVDCSVYI